MVILSFNKSAYDVTSSAIKQMILTLPALAPACIMLFRKNISSDYFAYMLTVVGGLILLILIGLNIKYGDVIFAVAFLLQIPVLWIFGFVGLNVLADSSDAS